MAGDMMEFPETFDEFVDSYGFIDTEEVYTNGSQLIPVFRVKQWLEHIKALSENKGEWIFYDEEFYQQGRFASVHHRIRECSICHHKIADFVGDMNFCPNCGADMRGE